MSSTSPSHGTGPIPIDPALEAAVTQIVTNLVTPVLAEFTENSPQTTRSKKRPHSTADGPENESPFKPNTGHYEYGRMFLRQGDLFLKVDDIVNSAIRHETKDSEDDTPLPAQNDRLLQCWEILCNLIPGFKTQMLQLCESTSQEKYFSGVSKARADDANSLKTRILDYVLLKAPDASLSPPLSSSGSKAGRGWHHPETARLLCPIKHPATEETYTKFRQGELQVTAAMFPRFLFPDDQVLDPKDMSVGILRGHLMPRACRHIFQGPSTVLEQPGTQRGNSGNAALAGLTSMTPRAIAYVAVQVRFALTSTLSWDPVDGTFRYSDFFWHIVGLFDNKDEARGHLQFFNYEVFGAKDGLAPEKPQVADEADDFEVARKQREEKRARITAAAAANPAAD